MKAFSLPVFLLLALFINRQVQSQTNSVALIPPTGPTVFYSSITSAYAAIPSSLPAGNNYIIELLTAYNGTHATEIYPIQLTNKNLPAGGSTITIRPAAGNTGETIRRPVYAPGNLIEINGGDNIIIDGRPGGISSVTTNYLNIVDLYTSSSFYTNTNISFINGATNNTVQNVNITSSPGSTDYSFSHVLVNISTSPTGQPNNNNTIINNIITGGETGVSIAGTEDPNTGNTISNNIIKDFSLAGISAGLVHDNTTIQNNTITLSGTVSLVTCTGIEFTGGFTAGNILNNTITSNLSPSSTTNTLVGIQATIGSASPVINIMNNSVTNLISPVATTINGIIAGSIGNATIINNTVGNFYSPNAYLITGISLNEPNYGTTNTISKNKVYSLRSDQEVSILGISLSIVDGGSTTGVNNNFISITDPNPNAFLIEGFTLQLPGSTPSAYTTNVFFNSIRIGGTQTGGAAGEKRAAGIHKTDNHAASIYKQKNNICIMERTGGTAGIIMAGFIMDATAGTLDIDYNTYYGANAAANSFAVRRLNTSYGNTALAAYKTASSPQEQNSNFSNVSFQSSTDLHLAGASLTDPLLNGVAIPGITLDIDGDTRKATAPTRGADENSIADIITNIRSGNWSDPTMWSNNLVPTSADNVLLNFTVTVDINAFCRSLNTHGQAVTVNSGMKLTVVH